MFLLELRQLKPDVRSKVASLLVEGNSIRGIEWIMGVSKTAILKLLSDLGTTCAAFHNQHVRYLKPKRLELGEIRSFVGCKQKNADEAKLAKGWGDAWTWVAIDPDTKLVISYAVNKRDELAAKQFLADCAGRITSRVQVTTDGFKLYPEAIEKAFGCNIDYGTAPIRKAISGSPDPTHVTSAHVARQNLSMRMAMRRFMRKTNGFSKTIEQHRNAVALYFMYYNFCRCHLSLRVTPAMEAGLTGHIWRIDEIVALLPKPLIGPSLKDPKILRRALERMELTERTQNKG
jgi:IS1 family transposase